MPGPASRLYAQNVTNVVLLMTREQKFDPDYADEIVAGMLMRPEPVEGPAGGENSTGDELSPPPQRSAVENSTGGEFSPKEERAAMSEPIIWLTIFVLAVFVGIEVISKVSSTLHTPLMSGANAIHGVILIGAILVAGSAESGIVLALALVAVALAAINMVGGFVVTDRMLVMFRPKKLEPRRTEELER